MTRIHAAARTGLLATVVSLGAATAALAQTTTLFDPQLGLPQAQGWLPGLQGPAGSVSLTANALQLDTTADQGTQQGWGRFSPEALDTATGFTLAFSLRVDAAASSTANRAGFSLLFTGQDPAHALALGFEANAVFAYDYLAADPDRFMRGASASFSAGLAHDYTLLVAGQQYSLLIDGSSAFSGNLQDYRADGLPYSLASFVFFGDDTSRAGASVAIGPIALVSAVPEPASLALWLAGLAGLVGLPGLATRARHSAAQPQAAARRRR